MKIDCFDGCRKLKLCCNCKVLMLYFDYLASIYVNECVCVLVCTVLVIAFNSRAAQNREQVQPLF